MLRARAEEAEQAAIRLSHRIEQAEGWLEWAIRLAREVRVQPEDATRLADALEMVYEAELTLTGR